MMPAASTRDHALDALRAAMMLLGLVIHSAAAYTQNPDRTAWPFQDPRNYVAFDLLALFIHIFRMPVFFVMAGFFAALLYQRDGARGFVRNRIRRVLLPLLVFLPTVMPLVGLGFVFALWRVGAQMPGADLPRPSLLGLPILGHLWFLYDLLIFYAATVVLMPLIGRISTHVRDSMHRGFITVATHMWGAAVLAVATTLPLLPEGEPGLGTSASLLPRVGILTAYAVFFVFGWFLFRARDVLVTWASRWKRNVAAGIVASVAYVAALVRLTEDPSLWTPIAIALCSLSMWWLIFGITGAFVRYLHAPRPTIRYLANAAYWIYLVHLPLVIWTQGALATAALPSMAKFTIVLGTTTAVTLVTYHVLVRRTIAGVLLNGRRFGAERPDAAISS